VATYNPWGLSADAGVAAAPLFDAGALLIDRNSSRQFSLTPQRDVRSCAVSPDGDWVATGSHASGVEPGAHVWNARTGEHVAGLAVPGLCQVGFSPDGCWLLTTGGGERLWRVGTWDEGPALNATLGQNFFAFSREGKMLALSDSTRGTIQL